MKIQIIHGACPVRWIVHGPAKWMWSIRLPRGRIGEFRMLRISF
jgi:hypothetical protein